MSVVQRLRMSEAERQEPAVRGDATDIRKLIYGAALSLLVAGIVQGVGLWYGFKASTEAQATVNANVKATMDDMKETLRVLVAARADDKVQIAELKEQTKYLDRRTTLMEDRADRNP